MRSNSCVNHSFAILKNFAAALSVCAAISSASAAEPQSAAFSMCTADLTALCPSVEAGNGKKMRCLLEHQAQLSASCDAAVKSRMATRANRLGGVELAQATPTTPAPAASQPSAPVKVGKSGRINKKACRAELASLCATTAGSRTKCLIANQSKLGPECAAAVAVTQQTREVAKAACVTDAAKLCGTARGPQRLQCLESNKAQLSPACLTRIEKKEAKQAIRAGAPAATPPKQ